MFQRFTEKALKVITLAQEESRSSGHNYIADEQILLGLIKEGGALAFKALKEANVTLDVARSEVRKFVGDGSDRVDLEIPYTPYAKRVLELAWDEARQLRHNYIGTEHLLLSLVREGDGVAVKVLQKLDVDLLELQGHLIESIIEIEKKEATRNPSYADCYEARADACKQYLQNIEQQKLIRGAAPE
jgi:ATP-dependent Clp protease ATP-binding subunit ClpC